ncbi:MAG: hypothetical protein WD557_02870 [Dehalococcoidia bacterium]
MALKEHLATERDLRRKERLLARMQRPWWRRHGEILRYGLAFVAYVGLGLLFEQVFSSWVLGVAFLVGAAWGIPALWRRLR